MISLNKKAVIARKTSTKLVLLAFLFLVFLSACSTTERPLKEMVFASSAMKSAQRARAERNAPDLYRRAELKFWAAKRYYLIKDYEKAKSSADEAKRLAEQAEIKASVETSEDSY